MNLQETLEAFTMRMMEPYVKAIKIDRYPGLDEVLEFGDLDEALEFHYEIFCKKTFLAGQEWWDFQLEQLSVSNLNELLSANETYVGNGGFAPGSLMMLLKLYGYQQIYHEEKDKHFEEFKSMYETAHEQA